MARQSDATTPSWDPLAPTTGVQPTRDALAGGYGTADALSGWSAGDALAADYGGDALAGAGPLTAVDAAAFGATTADSLAAYGDATAYSDATAPNEMPGPAATPRPGPVPPSSTAPETAGAPPAAGSTAAGRSARGPATRGRPGTRTAGSRRTPQSRSATTGATSPGRSATGTGAGGTGRPGAGVGGTGRSAGGTGRPGAGAGGTGRWGAGTGGTGRSGGAGSRRTGPTWEELSRMGSPAPQGRRYDTRSSSEQTPGSRGRGVPFPPPPWGDRTSRPTGTAPWSGRSGWDDFFAGMDGTRRGPGTPPSGADVARALIEALRRGLRGR